MAMLYYTIRYYNPSVLYIFILLYHVFYIPQIFIFLHRMFRMFLSFDEAFNRTVLLKQS